MTPVLEAARQILTRRQVNTAVNDPEEQVFSLLF
jgi:hypothetical protein